MSASNQEALQVEAIRNLTSEIPLNDFGLPTGVYRTDLLPFHDYKPTNGTNGVKVTLVEGNGADLMPGAPASKEVPAPIEYRTAGFPTKALSTAFVPLQYDEGFPAFMDGSPFWGRLEFEPTDAFQAFQRYLQMNLGRPASNDDDEDHGSAASGTRSVTQLATTLHPDSSLLKMASLYQGYYHLYYWGLRSHAYDLFRVAQHRQQQELRAIETQDEHYVQSRRIRHRLTQYMDNEEEFWDMMTPKVALEMHKHLTQLERISAGIPAAGPMKDESESNRGTPFEIAFRTVAQSNRTSKGVTITDEGEILDKALEDPAVTETLQELIIRSGR